MRQLDIYELETILKDTDLEYSEVHAFDVNPGDRRGNLVFELSFSDWHLRSFFNRLLAWIPTRRRKPEARLLSLSIDDLVIMNDEFLREFPSPSAHRHLEIDELRWEITAPAAISLYMLCEGKELQLTGRLSTATETPSYLRPEDLRSTRS